MLAGTSSSTRSTRGGVPVSSPATISPATPGSTATPWSRSPAADRAAHAAAAADARGAGRPRRRGGRARRRCGTSSRAPRAPTGRRTAEPETAACADAWAGDGRDLLGHLVALYAIESAQPAISRVKADGLREHYGFATGPGDRLLRPARRARRRARGRGPGADRGAARRRRRGRAGRGGRARAARELGAARRGRAALRPVSVYELYPTPQRSATVRG